MVIAAASDDAEIAATADMIALGFSSFFALESIASVQEPPTLTLF